MPCRPGDVLLGKYRIEDPAPVGQGAFAAVYRATHLGLNAVRALKVLRRDGPGIGSSEYADFQGRFRLEAQLGAALDHPHVIRVHDFEQDGETLLLVMEYAAGGSVAQRLVEARQAGRLIPIEEAVRIAREAAEGLAALHALDVVHRDVKPSNLLFDDKGRVKVSDLGLAQIPHGPSQRSLGGSLARPHPGTPAYMSPEQQFTTAYLAPPSDVYSLGVTLFELLTGRMHKNLKPGTRLRGVRGDAPEGLDELLARMLAKEPDGRPWDGAEAAEALAEVEAQIKAEVQAEVEVEAKAERQRIETDRRMAAEAARQPPIWQRIGIELIRIPAGEFLMGSSDSDKDAYLDEKPQRRLSLPEYWIARTPVTNAQYKAFVDATGRGAPGHWQGGRIPKGKEQHPVVYVSWDDAQAFCQWAGLRLPAEQEWEKAARGADGRIYPWGNAAPSDKLCNFNGNVGDTAPVGRYSPGGDSPSGLVDMAGNVWEWCEDWCDSEKKQYVLRGGSWFDDQGDVRATLRGWLDPEYVDDNVGFRCARLS